MLSVPAAVKLGYCPEAVDRRLGFDGLFALVRHRLPADPLSGQRFIFRHRLADRLKVLSWGGHGLCLWCQRLEAGRYHFPDAPADAAGIALSVGGFQMVLDGIDRSRVRRFQRFRRTGAKQRATRPPRRCSMGHGCPLPAFGHSAARSPQSSILDPRSSTTVERSWPGCAPPMPSCKASSTGR